MMTQQTLIYGDTRIAYRINPDPKRSTRIAIHVDPDGSVIVDAPVDQPHGTVAKAVQKRARWIVDHVNEAHDRYRHVRPKEYVSGEQVLYLGRRYVLKVIEAPDGRGAARLKGNRLEVHTGRTDRATVRSIVKAWYTIKARDYFARQIDEHATKLPWVTQPPPFRLLEMNRQWGSCSPTGKIILNPHLVKAPRECIGYVITHEMAHLQHHDHGSEFTALVGRYMPDWQRHKRLLDRMVEVLVAE